MKRLLSLLCLLACCSGCSIPGVDPPQASPHPFALTEKYTADSVAELKKISLSSATAEDRLTKIEQGVEATNAHLADLVTHFRQTVGQDGDLLNAVDKLRESIDKTQATQTPLRSSVTVIDQLYPDDLLISVDGQMVAMRQFVSEWYKQPWPELSGTVDDCLSRFGVAAEHLERLSQEAKEKLHGAIHEHAESLKKKPLKQKTLERTIVKDGVERQVTKEQGQAITPLASNCPGGVCPAPQAPRQQWVYQYSRRSRRR